MSSIKRSISSLATAENVSTGPVILFSIHAINVGAAVAYLKLYNKLNATHADTPVATLCIPGDTAGNGFTHTLHGLEFSVACSFRCVTEVADSGTTSPSANQVLVNVEYEVLGVPAISGA